MKTNQVPYNPLNVDLQLVNEFRSVSKALSCFDEGRFTPNTSSIITQLQSQYKEVEKALINSLPSYSSVDYDDCNWLIGVYEDDSEDLMDSDHWWLPQWFVDNLNERVVAEDKKNCEEWTRSYNDHAADCNR
jgi:hypothetical protein